MLKPEQLVVNKTFYIAVKFKQVVCQPESGAVLVYLSCLNSEAGFYGVPINVCGAFINDGFWNYAHDHKPEFNDEFYLEVIYKGEEGELKGKPVCFVETDNLYFGGCTVYTETLKDYSEIV